MKRHSGTPVDKYEPIARPIDLAVLRILALVSNNPDGVKFNLSLTGNVTVGGENFYFYERVYMGRRVLFVMCDLGGFLVLVEQCDSGTLDDLHAHNGYHELGPKLLLPQLLGARVCWAEWGECVEELPAYQCDVDTGECTQVNAEPRSTTRTRKGFISALYTINYTIVTVDETMIKEILELSRRTG